MYNSNWKRHFDERQLKEIEFCRHYDAYYRHGTDGHNIRLIVAKMAALLESGVGEPTPETLDNGSDADA